MDEDGLAYYRRHYHGESGELPQFRSTLLAHHDSVSWGFTNPVWGRGLTIGLVHARALRELLRETGPDEPAKLSYRFEEVTQRTSEPIYEATRVVDRHRRAELVGDATGRPYETDDPTWLMTKAVFAAAQVDHDALRTHATLAHLLAPASEVFAQPGVAERVIALGGLAPRYPTPGADRQQLLRALRG